jgi:CheY-like chemotaxis protein
MQYLIEMKLSGSARAKDPHDEIFLSRLTARNYRIPIIFITAYDSDRSQAFQAGAVGLLCKPFSQESLFQAVRSALANQHDLPHEC